MADFFFHIITPFAVNNIVYTLIIVLNNIVYTLTIVLILKKKVPLQWFVINIGPVKGCQYGIGSMLNVELNLLHHILDDLFC